MEYDPKASAAAAGMAAVDANANAFHARLAADAAEAYARRLEIADKAKAYGLSHAEVLRALDAAGRAKFEDMLAKEHPGEAIVPKSAIGKTKASELLSKVEIVNDGLHRLCFVNGHQVGQVLKLETPRARDMLAGVVEISFLASEIVERQVSSDEFKAIDAEGVAKSCGGGQPPAFDPWPEALAMGREIVRLNTQMARLLDRWDGEGFPSRRGEV